MRYFSWISIGASLLFLGLACGDSSGRIDSESDGTPDAEAQDEGGEAGDPRRNLRLLREEPDSRLLVEIDYAEGWKPRDGVSNRLSNRLEEVLEKPDGVEFHNDETLEARGSDHEWSFEELSTLASETFNREVSDDTVKLHVLFFDGKYEENEGNKKILGLAWGFKNIVIFKETLEESCQQSGLTGVVTGDDACATAVQSVWKHEFGHTFGLVDNKLAMQEDHRDEEHGHHCDNDECVMYWAYEGPKIFDRLTTRFQDGNDQTFPFGSNCMKDMGAAQE